ncbi:hypothetical protein [Falsibacillus albus]|uniref:Uncharacterized protein n=1 Tax=Falsibacillus albus TaxID=2478915 RepID=A0A3L7JNZ0_9BACI|nr:hypothetical protein [Falsibacillus albus]RLQ92416.1 hypothetical protein D9X91_19415 [Falsibacillus albus]
MCERDPEIKEAFERSFKSFRLDADQQRSILQKLQQPDVIPKKRINFQSGVHILLSACALIAFGTGVYWTAQKADAPSIKSAHGHKVVTTQKVYDKSIWETAHVSKEAIVYKMINTVDNFTLAKGTFQIHDAVNGRDPEITFKVNLSQNKAYAYIDYLDNGTRMISFNTDANHYKLSPNGKVLEKALTGAKETFTPDQKKLSSRIEGQGKYRLVKFRNDMPDFSRADESLLNENFVYNYLADMDNWSITNGSKEYFDRICMVLKGSMINSKQSNVPNHFELWVDKETGIILKLLEFDSNNHIQYSITYRNVQINEPIKLNEVPKEIIP